MFGYTIKKTADLEAQATALKNAQAQTQTQVKKTRTAMIIGGSTTAATAAAAIVAHKLFGTGKKINKEKLAKYDQIIEERDRVIGEKNEITKLLEEEKAMKMIAIGDADNLANSIRSGEREYMDGALNAHSMFRNKVYGNNNADSIENSMKMFASYINELAKADQTPATPTTPAATTPAATTPAATTPAATTPAATTPAATTPAATTPAATTNTATAEDLKAAQDAFDAACKKADAAKKALEDAQTADPNGDHSALQAAFDAADKELEDADKALKALQNNG